MWTIFRSGFKRIKMKKYIILQDAFSKKYFTDSDACYWHENIDYAKKYSTEEYEMEMTFSYMYNSNYGILDNIKDVIVLTIWSKD